MLNTDYWLRELRYRLGGWVMPTVIALSIVAVIQVIWHVAAWVVG